MKTTTFGGGAGKVQPIHRGFDNIVHFLLVFMPFRVQKTNQKRTPVPFGPPGNLCSSGVAENLRFEEQIFGNTPRCFGKRQWGKYFKARFAGGDSLYTNLLRTRGRKIHPVFPSVKDCLSPSCLDATE